MRDRLCGLFGAMPGVPGRTQDEGDYRYRDDGHAPHRRKSRPVRCMAPKA